MIIFLGVAEIGSPNWQLSLMETLAATLSAGLLEGHLKPKSPLSSDFAIALHFCNESGTAIPDSGKHASSGIGGDTRTLAPIYERSE